MLIILLLYIINNYYTISTFMTNNVRNSQYLDKLIYIYIYPSNKINNIRYLQYRFNMQ